MRLPELVPAYRDGATELVEVAPDGVDLAGPLRPPDDLPVRTVRPGAASSAGAGALMVVALGPDPAHHVDPADLPAALDGLPVGARIVLLCAWPVTTLPYHRLLAPLVAARCQVREAVPVDRSPVPGVACAVVADRVDAPRPPRAYLLDAGLDASEEPAAADPLGPVLRAVNEYVLADFVTRPLRRRLADLEAENARLRRALSRPRPAGRVAWRVSSRAARRG